MEKMYQTYKDVAEFRLVYIKEAHAADSDWAVDYAKELGITEHDDYKERCGAAEMLLSDEKLRIPFLVDDMEDSVNKAYLAWPDRVFLVRKDGRLAVAAGRGPFGFGPGVKSAKAWLKQFKATGEELPLPDDAVEPGDDRHVTAGGDESEEAP